MAESININELLEAANQYGIELTEDQLDGIAGGELKYQDAPGILTHAAIELREKLEAIQNAKESGMSVEDFIAANYRDASEDAITVIKLVWQSV